MNNHDLPDGLTYVRSTKLFDHDSVPVGLLHAHRIAAGVWGRLVVKSGEIRFTFENNEDGPITVKAGGHLAIPPMTPHHISVSESATFLIEFHQETHGD